MQRVGEDLPRCIEAFRISKALVNPKLPESTRAFFLTSVDPEFSYHVHLLPGQQVNVALPV